MTMVATARDVELRVVLHLNEASAMSLVPTPQKNIAGAERHREKRERLNTFHVIACSCAHTDLMEE